MVENYEVGSCTHFFNKFRSRKELEVKRAPEPTDIYWENLNQDPIKKILFRVVSFFVRILLLVISSGVITALMDV
jgi:hypothetical protein